MSGFVRGGLIGRPPDAQVERLDRPTFSFDGVSNVRCFGRRHRGTGEGHHAIASRRPPDRAVPSWGPENRGPNWDPRSLPRAREELSVLDREAPAVVAGRLARPQARDDLDPVVEQLRSFGVVVGFARERPELVPEVDPETYAQHEAATAEMVECHGLACHLPRPATRERGHERSQPDRRRRGGDGAERHPRIAQRNWGLVLDVVPQEEPVPACFLGGDGKLDERVDVAEGAEWRQVDRVAHGAKNTGTVWGSRSWSSGDDQKRTSSRAA